jgi:hypothetical protein
MTTPTVTEIRRNGNPVGERIELARYTVPVGQRVLYGQRVNGVVRFLRRNRVVLVVWPCRDEDGRRRPRIVLPSRARPNAVRPKRQNAANEAAARLERS